MRYAIRMIRLALGLIVSLCFFTVQINAHPIDRFALVNRHNPTLNEANAMSPFSVGNGGFAFTADVTGLQTFPDFYEQGIPLGTLSEWGWHTAPPKNNYALEDTFDYFDVNGREVPYASQTRSDAAKWLRANPHRLHLGQVGFILKNKEGEPLSLDDIQDVNQSLNLWQGVISSSFKINNSNVEVNTACHPTRDGVAVKVKTSESNLANVAVSFAFPYGAENWGPAMADWQLPDRHQTIVLNQDGNHLELERRLDHDLYFVRIAFSENCRISETAPHTFVLQPIEGNSFEFTFEFSPKRKTDLLSFAQETFEASIDHWLTFWSNGGAIDLSQSKDPRAKELERRIVLSQYLTAIQCASSSPPQESGLTHNSWFGKSHLEMHWWHAVHFAFWDRIDLLERSLGWYQDIMANAKQTAEMQGYPGARWPKMIGPDGRESPSGVGVFLIWQQPHPIYYAELCYRAHPNKETAQQYKDIVFETAIFMASYPQWDEETKRYVLGPPLIPAQECYAPGTTFNPTYEIAYWSWALKRAQEWRRRLGLGPEPKWQHVIDNLSALPQNNGVYVTTESTPDAFENSALRRDHPSLVAALGILPDSEKVDGETMRRTLHKIFDDWNWESTWGWDYPRLAMTAARLGEPELAIQALLMDTPKNHYMINGHCYQRPNLPTYLPANGGLLSAVAMMAAGWDNGPDANAPGFPIDWNVRWENLKKMP